MSDRSHDRITKPYASPSNTSSLKKPAMRLSPRKATSPQNYRIPPKRLQSPEILKRYQQRVQHKIEKPAYLRNNNVNTNNNNNQRESNHNTYLYTSPLKSRNEDNDIYSSFPQLVPNNNKVRSPRRDIPIDSSPIRGKNILSKLKQEISKIDALDKPSKVKKEYENTKKSVRFDIPSPENIKKENQTNTIKNDVDDDKGVTVKQEISYNQLNSELFEIKNMLTNIIKKQESQDLLLKEVLERQKKLEQRVSKEEVP